jgi:hypothetical protein
MSSSDLPWYATFNSGYWLSLTTLIFAFLTVTVRTCYKSKCSDFSCCFGLIKIKRDTDIEEAIDLKNKSLSNLSNLSSSQKYDFIPNQI